VCSAGPARAQQVIREALARGADRALHCEDNALGPADAFAAAAALAGAMDEEKFDLVLTGLQSDDQGHAQFGPILATRLGMSHSTIIMAVEVTLSTGSGQAGALRVKRELEGGWFQYVTMTLPALLTIQSGINQLRYATLKGIMAAKKKEIKKVAPAGAVASRQKILALYAPEKSKQTVMIGGTPAEAAKELVRRLREEARVL
jgi:electron transfer flavoprotein beta subunit